MRKFHGEKIRRRAASLEKTLSGTFFSSSMHMVHGWPPSWLGGQQCEATALLGMNLLKHAPIALTT